MRGRRPARRLRDSRQLHQCCARTKPADSVFPVDASPATDQVRCVAVRAIIIASVARRHSDQEHRLSGSATVGSEWARPNAPACAGTSLLGLRFQTLSIWTRINSASPISLLTMCRRCTRRSSSCVSPQDTHTRPPHRAAPIAATHPPTQTRMHARSHRRVRERGELRGKDGREGETHARSALGAVGAAHGDPCSARVGSRRGRFGCLAASLWTTRSSQRS